MATKKTLHEWTLSDVELAMTRAGMTHDIAIKKQELQRKADPSHITLNDLVRVGLATTKPGYSTQTQRELEKLHGPREGVMNEGPMRPGFEQKADSFLKTVQQKLDAHMKKAYPDFRGNDTKLEFMKGSKFWRIVAVSPGSRSAWGFLNTETGDVLKSAGWNAPAKGPRGNIFDADNGVGRVGPYGPEYMKGPSYPFQESLSLAAIARQFVTKEAERPKCTCQADQQHPKGPHAPTCPLSKDFQKETIVPVKKVLNPDELSVEKNDRKERDRADYERQVQQGSKDEAAPTRWVPGEEPEQDPEQRWVSGQEPAEADESSMGDAGPEGNTDDILSPSADRMWEKFYAAQERYTKSEGLKSESAAKRAMAFWHRRAVRAEARQLKETRRKRWRDHELHEDEKSALRTELYEFVWEAENDLDQMGTTLTKFVTRLSAVSPADASRVKEIIQHVRSAQERLATLKSRFGGPSESLTEAPYEPDQSGRRDSPIITPAAKEGMFSRIKPGSRVTIVNRFGQNHTGKAVIRGPAGWVLNMGGKHGTPGIASPENVVAVK